ncbi:MAG: hypothetical protein K0U38_10160 [Epsilonproteobacteria bacterium]|nr:hypothetical protein [Campylobacterota bacterium]
MKILLTTLLLLSSLYAELKIGENFPKLTLVDQFDKKVELPTQGTLTLIISFEKDVSADIKDFLNTKNTNFLSDNNITYISDISGMPTFVTNWFALPKMKKFDFKVALIYDEDEGKKLNREEKRVTIMTLKDNNITTIDFIPSKELQNIFK